MRQKLITLCPNSWEIAGKKPNFSKWVRIKLTEEENTSNMIHLLEDEIMWLRQERERMTKLLDDIRNNKMHWADGEGWVRT